LTAADTAITEAHANIKKLRESMEAFCPMELALQEL